MTQAYHQAYQQSSVKTATADRLILMLYDGAVSFLARAETAMEAGDFEEANSLIIRSQNIVSELMSSLDFQRGGQIAKDLYRIYEYLNYRLVQANIKKDPTISAEVRGLVAQLREAWEAASRKARENKKEPIRIAL